MIDGKSRISANSSTGKYCPCLGVPTGWAFQGSIMPFECLGVVGEGQMSGLQCRLGQL